MEDARLLIKRKDALEDEISAIVSSLESTPAGVKGPLVDEQGFPRSDCDLVHVRQLRNRLVVLQNDHTSLMNQIEKSLHNVHERARETNTVHSVPPSATPHNFDASVSGGSPFVMIDQVTEGSPASRAGIQVGDKVISFGAVTATNFRALTDVAAVVSSYVDSKVPVKVLRSGTVHELDLVPARWGGQGLLGCHIITL